MLWCARNAPYLWGVCDTTAGLEVLIVSHGPDEGPLGLVASLREQTLAPSRIHVWHNGPSWPPRQIDGVELHWSGEGVGYGEGINRLLELATSSRVLVATDDLVLDPHCVERIADELDHPSHPVAGAAALRGGEAA